DRAALQELVSDLITPPLDPTRPLWHVYLIEGFGEGRALLFRIHHCLADGMALAPGVLSLPDEEPDAGIAPPAAPTHSQPPGAGLLTAGRRVLGTVAHEGMETLIHPKHAARLAATAGRDAGTLMKLLAASSASRTVLSDALHGTRRVAWSKPFGLERVKRAGKRSSATINDVLVA